MLYELYLNFDVNIFKYISSRALVGFFIALFFTILAMPKFIKWANGSKNQPINKYAPKNHQAKTSTPTMGGVVFVIATIISAFFVMRFDNFYTWIGILVIVAFAYIGFRDDSAKIFTQNNEKGLSAKNKLLMQIGFGAVVSICLYFLSFSTELYIPFYKYPIIDMQLYAIAFWTLIMVSTSNAVNLTDGLDGLATFPSFVAFMTLGVFVYICGNAVLSSYLFYPSIVGAGELAILASCFAGSLLGFLWFNAYPAEVFMGDSGSLPVGAFMAYLAIIGKSEILLLLIGIIFVIETLSVILQVTSFKTRKKRIFLMAPIHHHFEMKGWSETKIIVRFWIIAFIANLLAILSLKFR